MIPEQELIPFEPSDLRGARVLVFAPHPDDETFGCGGALALHRRNGDPVRVVFVTSGERGDWQGGMDAAAVSARREAEAGRALAFLEIDEWEFWRLPDRGVEADGGLVERMTATVRSFRPTLIYAPSPLEIHPDHRAVAEALRAALRGITNGARVGFYEVGSPLTVNALVDVSAVWDTKESALGAYQSQLAGPDYRAVTAGLAHFRALTLSPAVKVAEGFRIVPLERLQADPIWRWEMLQRPVVPAGGPPAVSVVLRTRNRPTLLREALESLAAQTFRNFEVVVVNDGGEDVREIVAEFSALRTTVVTLPENRGRGAASNAGLAAACGEYVGYLDDDDLLYPPHLETLHDFLSRNDHFGGAYTDAHVSRYRRKAETLELELEDRRIVYCEEFDRDVLLYRNYIPNVCLMHRRSVLDRVGRFDPELPVLEDWDFVLRLAQEYSLFHIPRCTAEYRIRDDGTNLSVIKPWGGIDELTTRVEIYRRHWDKRTPALEAQVYGRLMEKLWELHRELDRSRSNGGPLGESRSALEQRAVDLERELAEACRRAELAEERAALLEGEAGALGSELVRSGQKLREQIVEGSRLHAETERQQAEIERQRAEIDRRQAEMVALHGEVASRQSLIDAIERSRMWRLRSALRRILGVE